MQLDPMAASVDRPDAVLRRLLGGMSIFTMLMTIPQVFDHMGWAASMLGFRSHRRAPIWSRPCCGFGLAYAKETRTSTWPASVGLSWTLP